MKNIFINSFYNTIILTISTFWIYYSKISIVPFGALLVLTIFLFKKNKDVSKYVSIILGAIIGVLFCGFYFSVQGSACNLGIRIGEIPWEENAILENVEKTDNIEQKILFYKKALEYDKKNIDIINKIGWNLLKIEKYNEAKEYFIKGMKIKDNEIIKNNLIIANKLIGNDALYFFYFGSKVAEDENDYIIALKFLNKSLESNMITKKEDLYLLYKNIGYCNYKLNRLNESLEYLTKALKYKNDDEELINDINIIKNKLD